MSLVIPFILGLIMGAIGMLIFAIALGSRDEKNPRKDLSQKEKEKLNIELLTALFEQYLKETHNDKKD